MLVLHFDEKEYYNEKENRIYEIPSEDLKLEHSLASVSEWESKWKVPFLGDKDKTPEQTEDYVRCMTISEVSDSSIYDRLTASHIKQVEQYINDKMTATKIHRIGPQAPSREIITAEVIYYWMIQAGIPFECDKWHLGKLITLIEVCSAKSGPAKKMNRKEQLAQQRALNAARCAKYRTRG